MLKNTLAIIVIGSLVGGSCFANSLLVKNRFMKDQIMKSSTFKKNNAQSPQSKFSGTWAGTCTHDGESDEVKYLIMEDRLGLSVVDLPEGRKDTISYDVLDTKTSTDKLLDSYTSYTSRLSKIDENTIKFERTEVIASLSNKEKRLFSTVTIATMIVNNNQLTVETVAKLSNERQSVDTCTLKRIG